MKQEEKALICKDKLMKFIKDYLEGNISSDEYYTLSENCYTKYGEQLNIFYPDFAQAFTSIIIDACLYYIDEPGLSFDNKESLFKKEIKSAYIKLKDI